MFVCLGVCLFVSVSLFKSLFIYLFVCLFVCLHAVADRRTVFSRVLTYNNLYAKPNLLPREVI